MEIFNRNAESLNNEDQIKNINENIEKTMNVMNKLFSEKAQGYQALAYLQSNSPTERQSTEEIFTIEIKNQNDNDRNRIIARWDGQKVDLNQQNIKKFLESCEMFFVKNFENINQEIRKLSKSTREKFKNVLFSYNKLIPNMARHDKDWVKFDAIEGNLIKNAEDDEEIVFAPSNVKIEKLTSRKSRQRNEMFLSPSAFKNIKNTFGEEIQIKIYEGLKAIQDGFDPEESKKEASLHLASHDVGFNVLIRSVVGLCILCVWTNQLTDGNAVEFSNARPKRILRVLSVEVKFAGVDGTEKKIDLSEDAWKILRS